VNKFYVGEPSNDIETKLTGKKGGGVTKSPSATQCVETRYGSLVEPRTLPMTYADQGSSLPGAVAHELAHAYYDAYFFPVTLNYGIDISHDYALMIENTVRGAQGLPGHQ